MTVNRLGDYADADYGWCAYCDQFSYCVITRGACGECRSRWDEYPDAAPRWYASSAEADTVYVVIVNAPRGPWYEAQPPTVAELAGLMRHSLREAREVYRLAMQAHMSPRIVHAVSLAVVTEVGTKLGGSRHNARRHC